MLSVKYLAKSKYLLNWIINMEKPYPSLSLTQPVIISRSLVRWRSEERCGGLKRGQGINLTKRVNNSFSKGHGAARCS